MYRVNAVAAAGSVTRGPTDSLPGNWALLTTTVLDGEGAAGQVYEPVT
jgi:hypothetical protein